MKKILSFTLALIMILTFAACDKKDDEAASTTPNVTTTPNDTTTEPDGTTSPDGTTAPNGTTVPDGTTTPDGTTKPSTTTKPAETEPPVTTDPEPDPKPSEGVKYTGYLGPTEMEIILLDGKGSLTQLEKEEMPADMKEELGLNGTVIGVMRMRTEFSSAVVSNGILTLSDDAPKIYRSASFEGTAAEEYIAIAKAQYKEMYEAGQIEKAEYDMIMSSLNGDEVAVSNDEFEGATKLILKVKLNDADKTCIVLKAESTENDNKFIAEYEYTVDEKLTKVTSYSIDLSGEYGNSADVTTFYPDGKTEKTLEEYDLFVNAETGKYELGALKRKREYREDGTEKLCISYDENGSYYAEEYDENENVVKESSCDENGNVTWYKTYAYTGDTRVVKEYDGNKLVEETHEKIAYEDEYYTEWEKVKLITYHEDGGRTETTYREKGNIILPAGYCDIKSVIEYDAEGNVTSSVEYDENGNVVGEQ